MNLAFKFPIIFWNCACLIVDSGGAELNEEECTEEIVDIYEPEDFEEYEYIDSPDKKTKIKKKRARQVDYKKIATAIGKMKQSGIIIKPPSINNSSYTFTPDVLNNQILYGLSGMLNVGEEIIIETIKNRPYISSKDYYNKVKPNKQAMISLIKGGAFDEMEDRKFTMAWFLWETCDIKTRLTLQNMPSLIKYNLVPKDSEEKIIALRIYEFNRYLKAVCKINNESYKLDERAINFLQEINLDSIYDENLVLNAKTWDRFYQEAMNIFREWISQNKEQILNSLNDTIFLEAWNKYAKGNFSSWEMEALCFYYHEHELKNVNFSKYNISDFSKLPEEPVVDKTFEKNGKIIKMFKLAKICGTCIAKDKNKSQVILLTPTGVATVKFRKEYFNLFDKQISVKNPDGSKTVKEKSWFNKGEKILIQGIRSGDSFIPKKYASTGAPHQLYHIVDIKSDGDIILQAERYQEND